MTLMARFSGTCPECGGRWQPGDLIRAEALEPGTLPTWQHVVCPDDNPRRTGRNSTPDGAGRRSERLTARTDTRTTPSAESAGEAQEATNA